ncbi:MAG: hypothetical protein GY793_11760 [Proteobacteria bacterium]|nr:hypothetical protein [Pseudomonadota bacterium]
MEWKELDINNIPSDFFVNERYEFLNKFQSEVGNVKFIDKINILKNLNEYESLGVTYRLKPLEPMRITHKMYSDLLESKTGKKALRHDDVTEEILSKIYGRPVEIIEE